MREWQTMSMHYIERKFNSEMLLNMKAGFGRFATALIDNQLGAWALNAVLGGTNSCHL